MKKQGFWSKQRYVKELTPVEHTILWTTVALSLVIFICDLVYSAKDPKQSGTEWKIYVSLAANIVSIFSVMAGVKKKAMCPLLGILGSLLLIPIAWADRLMATMIMFCCNAVAQTVSFVTWMKNSDAKASVKVVEIKPWQFAIYLTVIVGFIALFTWIESLPGYVKAMSFNDPTAKVQTLQIRIFDSAALMFSLGCFIPMMFRWKIVWGMYIFNDASQLATWICKISENVRELHQWLMLVSVISLLITSILGLVRWLKASPKNNKK